MEIKTLKYPKRLFSPEGLRALEKAAHLNG